MMDLEKPIGMMKNVLPSTATDGQVQLRRARPSVLWTLVIFFAMMAGGMVLSSTTVQAGATNADTAAEEGSGRWCFRGEEGDASVTGRILGLDSAPVANVSVNIYAEDGNRRLCRERTEDDGTFTFDTVAAGTYNIRISQSQDGTIAPKLDAFDVAASATVDLGDIQLEAEPETVSIFGQVTDADGMLLTELEGRVLLREYSEEEELVGATTTIPSGHGDSRSRASRRPQRGSGSSLDDGAFQIDAYAGQYQVELKLSRNGRSRNQESSSVNRQYYVPEGQEILVDTSDGISKTVTITVERYASIITGSLLNPDGTPATGIRGTVRAHNNDTSDTAAKGNLATIDSETGQYTLYIHPGTWSLSYSISTDDYLPYGSAPAPVTVEADQSATQEFSLIALDATIQGTVTDPDGNPIRSGKVKAQEGNADGEKAFGVTARVRNGEYTLRVASDRGYLVSAKPFSRNSWVQPATVAVTPTASSTITVDLQYVNPDSAISGMVTLDDGTVAANARIHAHSNNGQDVHTRADSDGVYQLDVVAGTWTLSAKWTSRADNRIYRTEEPLEVQVTSANTTTVDISLTPDSDTLPETTQDDFATSSGWSGELSDGTRVDIPARAIPRANDVTVTIHSISDELPQTAGDQPINYGYEINVHNNENGQEVTDGFDEDATITFTYSESDLRRAKITESDIVPAYYNEETDSWVTVSGYSIDTNRNEVSVQTDHFSLWALVYDPEEAPAASATPQQNILTEMILLPFVVQ
ncbi:MAG: carboxypeptidase-like regulatory domain-containing protein [Chloroflexota bacterium]